MDDDVKRTFEGAKAFADLADKPEDERIALIAAAARKGIVGFYVDDWAKADRYIMKLRVTAPDVRIYDSKRHRLGPGVHAILVRVGPRQQASVN